MLYRRHLCVVGSILIGLLLLINMSLQSQISYQEFDILYPVNKDRVAHYHIEGYPSIPLAPFFRGYFEMFFSENTKLSGSYSFSGVLCPNFMLPNDKIPDATLTVMNCYSMDLSRLENPSNSQEQLTINVVPEFVLNIDPYSVRILAFETSGVAAGQVNLFPLTPSQPSTPPKVGPWRFDFSPLGKSSFNFIILAYANNKALYAVPTSVNYPRELFFTEEATGNSLVLTYQHARVMPPTAESKPSVTVTMDTFQKYMKLDGYLTFRQYVIEENNPTTFAFDEIRTFVFNGEPKHVSGVSLDKFTFKCAYYLPNSNSPTLTLDETSQIELSNGGIVSLTCSQHITDSRYTMAILGVAHNYQECQVGTCKMDTSRPVSISEGDNSFFFEFQQNSQLTGEFKINRVDDMDSYSDIRLEKSIQRPLVLSSMIEFDFSSVVIDKNLPNVNDNENVITLKVVQRMRDVKQATDPFSLRLARFNKDKGIFQLVSQDIPSNGIVYYSFNLDNEIKSKRTVMTLGLFNYNNVNEKVGQLVYADYQRFIEFALSPGLSLSMDLDKSYSEMVQYNKRPFFTLSPYNVVPSTLENFETFNVLASFMQQNGNGFETLGFDETRTFSLSLDTKFKDEKGNEIIFKYTHLACAYLFRDSNYQVPEFSYGNNVDFGDEDDKVKLSCFEDIRTDSFVLMMVARKFVPDMVFCTFGRDNTVSSDLVFKFDSQDLPMDVLKFSFNANSRSKGRFTISREDTDTYSSYRLPKMENSNLSLFGIYSLDFNSFVMNSDMSIDTELKVIYEKNSRGFNFDPFSYKFFAVDSNAQEFSWLNSDETPSKSTTWQTDLDISKFSANKFKFAVMACNSNLGKFGVSYAINYERSLIFETSQAQNAEFSFNSPNLPNFESKTRFILQESTLKNHLEGLVSVKSFTIVQNVEEFLVTRRKFSFNTSLTDTSGVPVDIHSLKCVYSVQGELRKEDGILSKQSETEMTLECSNPIKSEIYDWHIVSKSTINPQGPDNKEDNSGTITFLAILVSFLIIFMIAMSIVIVVLVVKLRKSKNVTQHETSVNGETHDLNSQNNKGYLTL